MKGAVRLFFTAVSFILLGGFIAFFIGITVFAGAILMTVSKFATWGTWVFRFCNQPKRTMAEYREQKDQLRW